MGIRYLLEFSCLCGPLEKGTEAVRRLNLYIDSGHGEKLVFFHGLQLLCNGTNSTLEMGRSLLSFGPTTDTFGTLGKVLSLWSSLSSCVKHRGSE